MTSEDNRDARDLQVLAAIARGPGNYPTPSPERVERLLAHGLIKKTRRGLTLTVHGRVLAWLCKLGLTGG